MKKSILAVIFTAAAALGASAQCPAITIAAPTDEVLPGDGIIFVANVTGGDAKVFPTYNWVVSAGKIVSGQGTPVMTADSTGIDGQSITATVEIGGFDKKCYQAASATAMVKAAVKAQKYDEFGAENLEGEWARLDNFAIGLQNDPGAVGYIIVYGGRKSKKGYAAATIKRMKTYLVRQRGMDAARFKTVDGGLREDPAGELWLVPQGAAPPQASPTVAPKPAVKTPVKKKS
ncbi:MAG: hypothetical protein IPI64_14675 [Chloracidobacterium sp.]|nr:hypothetical protein [Chloracidobacterium sp.]